MQTKDWVEEIKRLYFEGSSMKEAVALVLRMIEEYKNMECTLSLIDKS